MTMQETHSPKPKIFGKGYGKHVSYNFKLMKRFFWLGWKLFANMLIPGAFYERAHWEVIDMYHNMRGYRHGTINNHRCDKCGNELLTADEAFDRHAELKDIERNCLRVDLCNHALDQMNGIEPKEESVDLSSPSRPGIAKYKLDISDENANQRIGEINHPGHLGQHGIDHK